MAKVDLERFKVVTPEFRVSYPSVFEPKTFEGQTEAKYQITMLFDKATDLSDLKKAVYRAKVERWGKDKAKWPKMKHAWLRDGDEEKGDTAGYENTMFCVAKSKHQPGLINAKRQKILDEDAFYPGCYARAQIIACSYDNTFGKGITLSLLHIQKLREGDKLSGGGDAEGVFDEVEGAEDDEENYEDDGGEPGF